MTQSLAERVAEHFLADMKILGVNINSRDTHWDSDKSIKWDEKFKNGSFKIGFGKIEAQVGIGYRERLRDKTYLSSVDFQTSDYLRLDWSYFVNHPIVSFFAPYRINSAATSIGAMSEGVHLLTAIKHWGQTHGRGISTFKYDHHPHVGETFKDNDQEYEVFIIYPYLYDKDYKKYFRE